MIYLLVKHLSDFLESHHLGFLRVFTFITFQTTLAVPLSFFIVILAGPRVDRQADGRRKSAIGRSLIRPR